MVKAVDPSNLLDSLIRSSPSLLYYESLLLALPLFLLLLCLSLIFYPYSGLPEQKVKIAAVSVKEGKSPWRGGDNRNRNVSKRMRQYGGEITGENSKEKRGIEAGTQTSYD